MRYIYYNILIILLATVAFGFWMFAGSNAGDKEGVLMINERVISQNEFAEREQYAPYFTRSRQEFIDEIINRELLIQEARRRNLDQEESFRHEIQDHYEQALIKQLLDRHREELQLEVSDRDIENWRQAMGDQVSLRLRRYANPHESAGGESLDEEKLSIRFAELTPSLQLRILNLQNGESTPPFPLESGYGVVRLDDREPIDEKIDLPDTDDIRGYIAGAREQIAMEQWLVKLRNKAKITVADEIISDGGKP